MLPLLYRSVVRVCSEEAEGKDWRGSTPRDSDGNLMPVLSGGAHTPSRLPERRGTLRGERGRETAYSDSVLSPTGLWRNWNRSLSAGRTSVVPWVRKIRYACRLRVKA